MDAARELPQLGQRDRELLADLVDGAGQPAVTQPRLEHPQVQRERDELLLRAVVQVALDPPPRVVRRLDDPQPRDPQLLHPRAQLGLQALVVDRERGGGGGRGDELRRRVELRVVDDRRHAHALVLHRGPRAPGLGVGQLDLAPGVVDEDLALGQPVGDVQGAIPEPLGQHLAHGPALDGARGEQPPRDGAHRVPDRLEQRDRHDRGRQRQQAQRDADGRPELPRPDEPRVVAREPAHAEPDEHDRQQHRREPDRQPEQHRRQLEQEHRRDPPVRAVAELLAHAAPGRRRRHGRDVRSEQPVGLAALALGEAPREPRRADEQRQPDPQRREHDAEREPAADHEQVREPLAETDDQVQQRPPRGAQVG